MSTKINRFLEVIRWAGVALGIFFAFYWGNNPQSQFSIFAIFTVIFLYGFTAIEGLFFSEGAKEVTGYGEGGGYARQSRINFISVALAMILAWLLGWGFYAYLALFIAALIFFTFSAINHFYTGLKEKFVPNTLLRPLLVIFLWAVSLYFLLPALKVA
jgi:fatty acid desaturase